jgi:hypothetical protein
MTIEQLRNAHRAVPFRPFTIRLADGQSFLVTQPDYLSHSPSGGTIIVFGDAEEFSILDLRNVTDLQFTASTGSSGLPPDRRA